MLLLWLVYLGFTWTGGAEGGRCVIKGLSRCYYALVGVYKNGKLGCWRLWVDERRKICIEEILEKRRRKENFTSGISDVGNFVDWMHAKYF